MNTTIHTLGAHMICSDTGKTQVVHLTNLKLDLACDIDSTIGEVIAASDGEGHVFLKILRGGSVSVIEKMTRRFRPQKKRPSC